MTMLATVDPYDVEDGAIIRPLHDLPGSDGVVVAHEIDGHGDETYQLGDGRTYWVRHGFPVEVVLTQSASADQIAAGDLIARDGLIVRVVKAMSALGDIFLDWRSDERRPDGTPRRTGRIHVRAREVPTVRIRLIDRPASGEAWQ